MADAIAVGDEVEVSFRGIVESAGFLGNFNMRLEGGYVARLYLGDGSLAARIKDGETKYSLTVNKIAPAETFEVDKAYIDADGDILIRTREGGWMTVRGNIRSDSYGTRPLRKLVPEG